METFEQSDIGSNPVLALTSPKVMRKHLTPYVHKVGWNGVNLARWRNGRRST